MKRYIYSFNGKKILLCDVTVDKGSFFGLRRRSYVVSLDYKKFYLVYAPHPKVAVDLVQMSTGENPKPTTSPPPLPGKSNTTNDIYKAIPISKDTAIKIFEMYRAKRKRIEQKRKYQEVYKKKTYQIKKKT